MESAAAWLSAKLLLENASFMTLVKSVSALGPMVLSVVCSSALRRNQVCGLIECFAIFGQVALRFCHGLDVTVISEHGQSFFESLRSAVEAIIDLCELGFGTSREIGFNCNASRQDIGLNFAKLVTLSRQFACSR